MINVLITDEETIKDRILSYYSLEDVINILQLSESEVIMKLLEENWERIEEFTDVLAETDYQEDGEEVEEEILYCSGSGESLF